MAEIDLSTLTKPELVKFEKDVAKAIKGCDDRKRAEALAELEATAKKHGFTVAELTGSKAKAAAIAKYKHPENPTITWSGRGRQPQWFKEAIEAGSTPESLLIG